MIFTKIIQKFILFSPICLIIVLINYFSDPANIFKHGLYEKGIASLLLSQKNVAGIKDHDERIVQKFYVENLKKRKEIIVLGSSRSLQIRNEIFPGKVFFNNSVSGATIEDFMAIYDLYYSKNFLPDLIVLGLDPWIFNANNNQKRWRVLFNNYKNCLVRAGLKEKFSLTEFYYPHKFLNLFSVTYFQKSISRLIEKIKEKENQFYFPTDQEENSLAIKRKDGSLVYDKKTRTLSKEALEKNIKELKENKTIYSLENYSKFDKNLVAKFEAFINLTKKDKIEVIFFLPPYPKEIYAYLKDNPGYEMVFLTESYLRTFALKNNIKVAGSYNPQNYTDNILDFYDGLHPRESLIKKIFEKDIK